MLTPVNPRFIASFVLCALFAAGVYAQSTANQEISGQVTDPSGGVVPSASVTVMSADTDLKRTVPTNSSGNFVVANLPIGHYNISVEAQGFKKYTIGNVELTVDSKLAVNPKLEIGSISDSVTVQADAVQVETASGEVGRLITGEQASQIQLNGRNFPQLLALVPGVSTTYSSGFSLFGGYGVTNSSQSANGGRTDTFSWNLDGVDNKDNGGGGNNFVNINPDAIAEFKMLTTNYSAEYGNSSGGVVNLALKSGTQRDFHGVAYEYFRNDAIPGKSLQRHHQARTALQQLRLERGRTHLYPQTVQSTERKTVFLCRGRLQAPAVRRTQHLDRPHGGSENGEFFRPCKATGRPNDGPTVPGRHDSGKPLEC